ncbi:MAG: hypothetical protein HN961_02355 [Planctomycetes bacterium]|nr:hypothetical protein [Planctomycetota bacterium]
MSSLFCIFSAELLVKEYAGGSWTWNLIFDALNQVTPELQNELYPIVRKGMRWWRRDIATSQAGRRQYLRSLMKEGGFPSYFLQKEGSIRDYFRQVLAHQEMNPALGLEDLTMAYAQDLPKEWRNTSFCALAENLLEQVMNLRAEFPDIGNAKELDILSPSWRQTFPLNLSATGAITLIEGLLRAPRKTHKEGRKPKLILALHLNGESATVERLIHLPRALIASNDTTDSRLRLCLTSSNGARIDLPSARLDYQQTQYVLGERTQRIPIPTQTCLASWSLTANGKGYELRDASNIEKVPWVFSRSNPYLPFQYLTVGSIEGDAPVLYIALPEDATTSGHWKKVAQIPEHSRILWELSTDGQASLGDATYNFAPKAETTSLRNFSLKGELSPFQSNFGLCYMHAPSLFATAGDSDDSERISSGLQWKGSEPGAQWQELNPDYCLGEGKLRLFRNSQTLFSEDLVILPRLEVEYRRIQSDCGHINLYCDSLEKATPIANADFLFKTTDYNSVGDAWVVKVIRASAKEKLSPIGLTLSFANGNHATIEVAAPFSSCYFLNQHHEVLTANDWVSIRQLKSCKVKVFATPRCNASIKISYQNNRHGFSYILLRGDEQEARGSEIRVFDLDDFANQTEAYFNAACPDLDSQMTLSLFVSNHGETQQQLAKIILKRFSFSFDTTISSVNEEVHLQLSPKPKEYEKIDVLARPAWSPTSPPTELEKGRDGAWLFATSHHKGPWLITAGAGWSQEVRPTLMTSSDDFVDSLEPELLDSALLKIFNEYQVDLRTKRYQSELLPILESDILHPEWEYTLPFLKSTRELPATTFDLLRVFTSSPKSMAMAAIRMCHEPEFDCWQEAMQELAFDWSFVSRNTWKHALGLLEQNEVPESFVAGVYKKLKDTFGEAVTMNEQTNPGHVNNPKRHIDFLREITSLTVDFKSNNAQRFWPQRLSKPRHDPLNIIAIMASGSDHWRESILAAPIVMMEFALDKQVSPMSNICKIHLLRARAFDATYLKAATQIYIEYELSKQS